MYSVVDGAKDGVALGVCAQCVTQLGVDPLWGNLLAALVVVAGRVALDWLKARKAASAANKEG